MNDFFKHGSRWVRADFHLHTASADEFNKKGIEEATYAQDFVSQLQAQGIQLAVVTNHNKFDKAEFVALKAVAERKGIKLLAGVEFSAKNGQRGIHVLIVFDDGWYEGAQDHINTFLDRAFLLKPGYNKAPYDVNSDYDLCEAVKELDKFRRDYFLVMAHVDHKNGLLEEVRGRNLKDLVGTDEYKKRVLAFQKSTARDKRTNCEQLMGRKLALVEGSDNAKAGMEGVGACNGNERKCYLKLGAFTFEAVKFALLHHEERVRSQRPDVQELYLHEIEVEREEHPIRIPLSPDLNTLIGVRGSGKSTLLETVRFGLGLEANSTPQGYKNDIVRRFIGAGSWLLLHLANADGQVVYTVRREWGGRIEVLDENGVAQSGLLPVKLLPTAYYGQKDIEELGKDFGYKYIEDKLLREKLVTQKEQEARLVEDVGRIFRDLQEMAKYREQLDETQQRIANLQLEIKQFEESGLQGLVSKELNFADDESKIDQISTELEEMAGRLLEVVDSYGWASYLDYRPKEATNHAFFEKEVFPVIEEAIELSQKIAHSCAANGSAPASLLDRWGDARAKFGQLRDSLQEEFRQAKQKINNPDIDIETHKRNKRELEQQENKRVAIERQLEKAAGLGQDLAARLSELEAHRRQMYDEVNAEIQLLNDLGLSFRIDAVYQGDKENFKHWLADKVKRLQRDNHARRIAEAYSSPIEIYRDLDEHDSPLADILRGGNLLDNCRAAFREDAEMLTYRVPDKYEFLYNGKPLEQYSIGQKSTALISFVLAHEDKKLFIIDQPEDDLDNHTVAKEIIGRISHLKPSTQFIFATHNPNILVLGDSEQVVACKYHDDKQRTEFSLIGSIDNELIQQEAINIMEGGREAFDRRKNIYQTWKH
jgi:predicted ATPase